LLESFPGAIIFLKHSIKTNRKNTGLAIGEGGEAINIGLGMGENIATDGGSYSHESPLQNIESRIPRLISNAIWSKPCQACGGKRLKEALVVTLEREISSRWLY
jgi:hypothetical protein